MGARFIVAGLSDSWAETGVSRTDIVTISVLAVMANMVPVAIVGRSAAVRQTASVSLLRWVGKVQWLALGMWWDLLEYRGGFGGSVSLQGCEAAVHCVQRCHVVFSKCLVCEMRADCMLTRGDDVGTPFLKTFFIFLTGPHGAASLIFAILWLLAGWLVVALCEGVWVPRSCS